MANNTCNNAAYFYIICYYNIYLLLIKYCKQKAYKVLANKIIV